MDRVIITWSLQDWHDASLGASWRNTMTEEAWRSALKPIHVAFRSIPGLEDARRAFPDSMHSFHLGWGQDLAASAIVLLTKFKLFEGRNIDVRLETAFSSFMGWCQSNGKTTSIIEFSKTKFDMGTGKLSKKLVFILTFWNACRNWFPIQEFKS